MNRRSTLDPRAVIKSARHLARHPWIFTKLAKLQAEKAAFGLFNPQAAQGRAGKIHQLSIRITDLCNLRCHTCGQWGDSGFLHGTDPKQLKHREVDAARYQELISDLVTHGHSPNVYLWGGEPMLYPGSLEVIEHATALGLPCSVATNGHLVAKAAARLAKAPLFLMQLSIDGHDAATHNHARPSASGVDNAYGDIETALEALNAQREQQIQNQEHFRRKHVLRCKRVSAARQPRRRCLAANLRHGRRPMRRARPTRPAARRGVAGLRSRAVPR